MTRRPVQPRPTPESRDGPTRGPADVHRLHPMRLLLVSDDRGLCGVASLLLGGEDFAVRTTPHGAATGVVEVARAHRADVVLVDELPSRLRAARTVAALDLLYPRARALMLCERAGRPAATGDRIARSSSIGELRVAVERRYAGDETNGAG